MVLNVVPTHSGCCLLLGALIFVVYLGGGLQFESTQPYATVACLSFIQFRSNYCQRIKHALRR